MKKVLIIIGIYIIIAGTLLCIISIPLKEDQEEIETNIQHDIDNMKKNMEEHWPDMPEDVKKDSLKINENIIRSSYESSNTFSAKFSKNLRFFIIGIVIVALVAILHYAHAKELWRN